MSLQNAVEQVLNPLSRLALLNGTILKDRQVKSAESTKIEHQLNRQPLGWFPIDHTSSAVVYRTDWSNKTISLQASADCTVDIWIF
jgi:hypothetical protein